MQNQDSQTDKAIDWFRWVTPLLVTAGAAFIHLDIQNQTAALKQQVTEQYETKNSHDQDVAQIKEGNQKTWETIKDISENQSSMRVLLQKVADKSGVEMSDGAIQNGSVRSN